MVAREVIPEIIKKYVDTGKARLVYREWPLTSIHDAAQKASEAAVCAGKQGKYWEMNDTLYASQSEWSAMGANGSPKLKQYAQELGLDTAAFATCLDTGQAALDIQGDALTAEQLGLQGTPSIFVNDIQLQSGVSIELIGTLVDYLSAGGEIPDILPQTEDYHLLGSRQTAKAATVAFVDYASADSRQHALEVLPQLKETYIDTGKLLYMLHPWAAGTDSPSFQGARAAECAGEQDKYWEMHTQLFTDQATWTAAADPAPLFIGYAGDLGLDTAKFEQCLASQAAALRAQSGKVVGTMYGVSSAPLFLFNNSTGQEGSPTFEEFKTTIDSIIGQ